MRARNGDDRGAGSVEFGLLLAGIAVVAVPILFALGRVVYDTYDSTCESFAYEVDSDTSCGGDANGGPPAQQVGQGGPGNGAVASATDWALAHAGEQPQRVRCRAVPPGGTSTTCKITHQDGSRERVVVTWDAAGNPEVHPAPPA
ncbi:MAG: Flp family type IVb pilin [Actinomycetes bacterium]